MPTSTRPSNAAGGARLVDGLRHMNRGPQPVHAEAVPGRNNACPCGSGAKFKKCCAK